MALLSVHSPFRLWRVPVIWIVFAWSSLLLLGCGRLGYGRAGLGANADASQMMDASSVACKTWGPFGLADAVVELNTFQNELVSAFSHNGLRLYFSSNSPDYGANNDDLLVTTRVTLSAAWGSPTRFAELDTIESERDMVVSDDELEAYFTRTVSGVFHPFSTSRPNLSSAWTTVSAPDNALDDAAARTSVAALSYDGKELYVVSDRAGGAGGTDIWVFRRVTPNAPWGSIQLADVVLNSGVDDYVTSLSADGLELFGHRQGDLWRATRSTSDAPWSNIENLPVGAMQVNQSDTLEATPVISPDSRTLYFASDRNAVNDADIFRASRSCLD